MKIIKNTILLLMLSFSALAQESNPVIKQGTTLKYTFDLHGQHAAFQFKVEHKLPADTLKLIWAIRGLAAGTYIFDPKGLEQANHLNFAQPIPSKKVKLLPNETFCMISRNAFKDLKSKHQFTYDNTVYDLKDDVKENPLMLAGNAMDVLHVVAENETTEFWILNNPDFPFICQIKGNPLGIDIKLNAVVQSE